jgi:hypothetical protein
MRKLFNEIQNAETATGTDFSIKEVIYNLLGEVVRFEGVLFIDSSLVSAFWYPSGEIAKLNHMQPTPAESEKYSLFVRRRLGSDNKPLDVFWKAVSYYILSGGIENNKEYKLINGKYLALKLNRFQSWELKAYCRKARFTVSAFTGIGLELEKQPYHIHKNSLIYKSIESELTGYNLVCDIKLLNLDIDFESLKEIQK